LGLRGTGEESEQDEIGWGGRKSKCDRGGEMEEKNASRVLVGKLEKKKSFGRTRCDDSIKTDIKRNRMRNCINSAGERDEWRVAVITELNIKVGKLRGKS
jgi:hypothetical protein